MSLSGPLIDEIVARRWRVPILKLLADEPKRYAEIRRSLRNPEGHPPGEGTVTAELRSLRELGLVEQLVLEGTPRKPWALTGHGRTVLLQVNNIGKIVDSAHAGKPVKVSTGTEVEQPWGRGLELDEIEARALKIDSSRMHPARRYDWLLGGKDHFEVDREAGRQLLSMFPSARLSALENRRFLQRAVACLAGELGIDQFLDIGTGLPTANNTHEVAQHINPGSRVVFVDNDPLVLAHARALLTGTPQGRTDYIDADLRDPDAILQRAANTLDFDRPVAVLLFAVVHFIEDDAKARDIVRRLVEALPPGSYLAASHITIDTVTEEEAGAYRKAHQAGRYDAWARTKAEFTEFFDGLEFVDPGVVAISDWRSPVPPDQRTTAGQVASYGAVARKPY